MRPARGTESGDHQLVRALFHQDLRLRSDSSDRHRGRVVCHGWRPCSEQANFRQTDRPRGRPASGVARGDPARGRDDRGGLHRSTGVCGEPSSQTRVALAPRKRPSSKHGPFRMAGKRRTPLSKTDTRAATEPARAAPPAAQKTCRASPHRAKRPSSRHASPDVKAWAPTRAFRFCRLRFAEPLELRHQPAPAPVSVPLVIAWISGSPVISVELGPIHAGGHTRAAIRVIRVRLNETGVKLRRQRHPGRENITLWRASLERVHVRSTCSREWLARPRSLGRAAAFVCFNAGLGGGTARGVASVDSIWKTAPTAYSRKHR